MSTAAMKSSPSSASSSRAPSGVDSTGLPERVSIVRIWPGPGVVISSRSADTGSSPAVSGRPRTRDCQASWWPRPIRPVPTASIAGEVNIAPPTESRLPVTMLSRLTAHWHTEPNSCVETPTRP